MLRTNRMSGFTLIKLMVVIVIIGVLASLVIPRFTEASSKAKAQEAPRIIASFESGYLAGIAEYGSIDSLAQLVVKIDAAESASKWFKYDVDVEAGSAGITATARSKIGGFADEGVIGSNYDNSGDEDKFKRCSDQDQDVLKKLIPSFAESVTETSCS